MFKTLTAIAAIGFCGIASATYCDDGSTIESHPNGDCNYKEPKKHEGLSNRQSANAASISTADANSKSLSNASIGKVTSSTGPIDVSQRQQQAQQQGQVLSNRNSSNSLSGGGAGGSVSISGNADGGGDRSTFTAWAPIIHGPAAPALAADNLVVVPGVCGPRVRVIQSQIMGQHYGPMGGRYDEQRGYMDTLGPWLNEDGNPGNPFVWRDGYMLGHVVTQYAAVVGTSSAASFSVGGFVDSKGLQGGAAGSGAAQQLVKSLQVMDCVMPTVQALPLPVPRPVYKPRPRPVRKVVSPCPVTVMQCSIVK